jgi:uncharacterized protein YndB with AHSA1/START domain
MECNGTITARPGCYEIRIARLFPHAPGKLWEALTKPEKLVQWLAPGKIELCQGGAARLAFADSGIAIDSTVTEIRPPNVIAYSWSSPGEPERPLRFESRIVPGATELTLSVKIPANEDAARTAAGFEAHLEMLAAALEDVPIKFPFQQFKAMRESYKAALAA